MKEAYLPSEFPKKTLPAFTKFRTAVYSPPVSMSMCRSIQAVQRSVLRVHDHEALHRSLNHTGVNQSSSPALTVLSQSLLQAILLFRLICNSPPRVPLEGEIAEDLRALLGRSRTSVNSKGWTASSFSPIFVCCVRTRQELRTENGTTLYRRGW